MNRRFKEKDRLRALKYESIFNLHKRRYKSKLFDIHIKNGAAVR